LSGERGYTPGKNVKSTGAPLSRYKNIVKRKKSARWGRQTGQVRSHPERLELIDKTRGEHLTFSPKFAPVGRGVPGIKNSRKEIDRSTQVRQNTKTRGGKGVFVGKRHAEANGTNRESKGKIKNQMKKALRVTQKWTTGLSAKWRRNFETKTLGRVAMAVSKEKGLLRGSATPRPVALARWGCRWREESNSIDCSLGLVAGPERRESRVPTKKPMTPRVLLRRIRYFAVQLSEPLRGSTQREAGVHREALLGRVLCPDLGAVVQSVLTSIPKKKSEGRERRKMTKPGEE